MIYILFLTFLATMTSQSAMDLFITILTLTLVYKKVAKKGPPGWNLFPKTRLELFWVVWFAVLFIGFVLNGHLQGTAMWKHFGSMRWVLSLYIIISAYEYLKLDLEKMLRAVLYVLGFVCAVGLIVLAVKYDLWEGRVAGFYKNPMTTAHAYSLPFLMLSAVFLARFKKMWTENRKDFYIWSGILTVSGIALFLTMTRGVWIGIFFGLLSIALVLSYRVFFSIIAAAVVGVTALLFTWPKFYDRFMQAFNYQSNNDSERVILWKTNLMMFRDNPLFGVGYGENYTLLGKYYAMQGLPENQFTGHAHNQFIHVLAGSGLIGLACYVFLYFYFVVQAWRILKFEQASEVQKVTALGIFGALIGFAFGGLTEANFEHAKVRMVVLFLWALLVYMEKSLGLDKKIKI